jgi:hypothetical protein
MDARGILALFIGVALPALHARQFIRVRHLFYIAVAAGAVQGGVGRCLQGRSIEARGHARLPFPYTRARIMASGAILGLGRRLLPAQPGGQRHHGQSQAK